MNIRQTTVGFLVSLVSSLMSRTSVWASHLPPPEPYLGRVEDCHCIPYDQLCIIEVLPLTLFAAYSNSILPYVCREGTRMCCDDPPQKVSQQQNSDGARPNLLDRSSFLVKVDSSKPFYDQQHGYGPAKPLKNEDQEQQAEAAEMGQQQKEDGVLDTLGGEEQPAVEGEEKLKENQTQQNEYSTMSTTEAKTDKESLNTVEVPDDTANYPSLAVTEQYIESQTVGENVTQMADELGSVFTEEELHWPYTEGNVYQETMEEKDTYRLIVDDAIVKNESSKPTIKLGDPHQSDIEPHLSQEATEDSVSEDVTDLFVTSIYPDKYLHSFDILSESSSGDKTIIQSVFPVLTSSLSLLQENLSIEKHFLPLGVDKLLNISAHLPSLHMTLSIAGSNDVSHQDQPSLLNDHTSYTSTLVMQVLPISPVMYPNTLAIFSSYHTVSSPDPQTLYPKEIVDPVEDTTVSAPDPQTLYPKEIVDPIEDTTVSAPDPQMLYPKEIVDPVEDTTVSASDPQTLYPKEIVDPMEETTPTTSSRIEEPTWFPLLVPDIDPKISVVNATSVLVYEVKDPKSEIGELRTDHASFVSSGRIDGVTTTKFSQQEVENLHSELAIESVLIFSKYNSEISSDFRQPVVCLHEPCSSVSFLDDDRYATGTKPTRKTFSVVDNYLTPSYLSSVQHFSPGPSIPPLGHYNNLQSVFIDITSSFEEIYKSVPESDILATTPTIKEVQVTSVTETTIPGYWLWFWG